MHADFIEAPSPLLLKKEVAVKNNRGDAGVCCCKILKLFIRHWP